ncbi:hypothetical protein [Desulfonatronum thioautotrophicum]|uniref:hypothetical protein n=1 Tax=Desulfonatronum thioautotrophicum TaxID=617001 RepID=UPI0005EB8FEA|nr:hypothetical protein [Desulfonatronum thioautotrophicum]
MPLIKEKYDKQWEEAWNTYVAALEKSLDELERDIEEAAGMTEVCTDEWCAAAEHVIDELNKSLYAISEPRWSSEEDSRRIKELKRRVYDLYAKYRNLSQGVAVESSAV